MDYLSARFAKIDDAAAELGKQLVALVGEKQVARKADPPQTPAQAQPKSQAKPPTQTAGVSSTKPPITAPITAQPQPQQVAAAEEKAESAERAESADDDAPVADGNGRPSIDKTTATNSPPAATASEVVAGGEGKSDDAAAVE